MCHNAVCVVYMRLESGVARMLVSPLFSGIVCSTLVVVWDSLTPLSTCLCSLSRIWTCTYMLSLYHYESESVSWVIWSQRVFDQNCWFYSNHAVSQTVNMMENIQKSIGIGGECSLFSSSSSSSLPYIRISIPQDGAVHTTP